MRGNISKRGPQGEKGEKGDAPKISFEYDEITGDLYYEIDGIYMSSEEVEELLKTKSSPKYSYVTILGGDENWVKEEVIDSDNNIIGKRYGQAVTIQNAEITPNSKIDLQLTPDQLVVFYEKDLAFVTENDNGVVTIYCIGQIPQNDYTIQAIITEVVNNG